MKKIITIFVCLFSLFTCFSLTSCNTNNENTIVVGTMSQPGQPILNSVKTALKEKGYELKIQLFSDFNTPNQALAKGSIDANLFQHEPFLNTYNEKNNTDLFCAAKLYDCVYGGYTKKGIKSVEEIPNGAKILIANDASNMKRCLLILASTGLIKLVEDLPATLAADPNDYIVENTKELLITPMDTDMIAKGLTNKDVYLGLVNATFAIAAGLTSNELVCQEADPEHVNANILACRSADKDSAKIKALVEVLTSDATATFINDTFSGTIVPYFVSLI